MNDFTKPFRAQGCSIGSYSTDGVLQRRSAENFARVRISSLPDEAESEAAPETPPWRDS
jgi:hypothetical protein